MEKEFIATQIHVLCAIFAKYGRREVSEIACCICHKKQLEMLANAQRDGRPAKYRWRPLFNAAKFG